MRADQIPGAGNILLIYPFISPGISLVLTFDSLNHRKLLFKGVHACRTIQKETILSFLYIAFKVVVMTPPRRMGILLVLWQRRREGSFHKLYTTKVFHQLEKYELRIAYNELLPRPALELFDQSSTQSLLGLFDYS